MSPLNEEPSLAMDMTLAIVELYFDTKGNIEKKLGDLANVAIGYWPFYIVPINDNNAYLLEGKGLYSEKIKTRIDPTKIPVLSTFVDEGSVDRFLVSIDKFVSKSEGFSGFDREEKKIDGLIPTSAFQNYFVHLFKNSRALYFDTWFALDPSISETAVKYAHEEMLKIFDDEPIEIMKKQQEGLDELCEKWVAKLDDMLTNQEQDPVQSLKNKGAWQFPELAGPVDSMIEKLKSQISDIRSAGRDEQVKESINLADQAIATTGDIDGALEDFRKNLKNLDDKITQERNGIDSDRKSWQNDIDSIRKIQERMRQAVKGFEDQEATYRSQFLEGRTIAFKTDKVVTCGLPSFLFNFLRKGKQETTVLAPVILDEVSTFRKTPFQEPKGYNDYEKLIEGWFTKPQNAYEVQNSIKRADIFSLPNLKIDISNGFDHLLDVGYLDKKKHNEIRNQELHKLFTPGKT
ncbi:MAG TPA: hypothetical protein VKM55_25540 [Candidatus Lokiarchaeia archaeon]|nr:hypothetical protein [Candidatus Lokiarchaeia archaeon]